jgi:preprotein translocase subunit SecE
MELTKAANWPERTRSYFEEVKAEMRRVSWPTWPQVRATTGVVIAAVFLFAAYFEIVDLLVNSAVTKILNSFR